MSTVSTRIPKELEKDLYEYMQKEKLDKSVALRKLISQGLEDWKKEIALKMLASGEVSFSKAAEIAGMDVWEFSNLVKDKKITWIKDERIIKDIGE